MPIVIGAAPGGGAAALDFSGLGPTALSSMLSFLGTAIEDLQGDTAGDSVAGVLVKLDSVFVRLTAAYEAVGALNTVASDADLTALYDGINTASTGVDAVYTNLEADVGGDQVAQAITDLQAIVTALNAL